MTLLHWRVYPCDQKNLGFRAQTRHLSTFCVVKGSWPWYSRNFCNDFSKVGGTSFWLTLYWQETTSSLSLTQRKWIKQNNNYTKGISRKLQFAWELSYIPSKQTTWNKSLFHSGSLIKSDILWKCILISNSHAISKHVTRYKYINTAKSVLVHNKWILGNYMKQIAVFYHYFIQAVLIKSDILWNCILIVMLSPNM